MLLLQEKRRQLAWDNKEEYFDHTCEKLKVLNLRYNLKTKQNKKRKKKRLSSGEKEKKQVILR